MMQIRGKGRGGSLNEIDLLEECMENESGERCWKRVRTRKCIKRRDGSGMFRPGHFNH